MIDEESLRDIRRALQRARGLGPGARDESTRWQGCRGARQLSRDPATLQPSNPAPGPLAPGPAVAFFDLDGTMAEGHMIFDFPRHLEKAGLFDAGKLAEIQKLSKDFWAGKVDYRRVAEGLPGLYALGLKGRGAKAVGLQAEKFVEGRMGSVFSYSRALVQLLRESGRPALAISGSPENTVRALARRLGMEAAVGTELAIEGGRFTGEVRHNLILRETKRALYVEVVKRLGLDASRCFGFGDTEQDIAFLGKVGHPVALNPSAGLRAIALRKGWPIFGKEGDVVVEVRMLLEGLA